MRKEAAKEFLDKELKITTDINIISTKISQTSPLLWIELEDYTIADIILKQSAKVRNPDGRAIGHTNLELWIKNIGDLDYIKNEPNLFGPYTQPNLDQISTLLTLGVSPPKGHTLKRARDSPGNTKNPSKHPVVTLTNLKLRPSCMNKEEATPTKTTNQNKPQATNQSDDNQEKEPSPTSPVHDQEESIATVVNKYVNSFI